MMNIYQILSLLGIPSLVSAILVAVWTKSQNKAKEYDAIKNGMVAILHNMVYTQGKDYIKQGWITIEDMKDYEYLYTAYHSLGGNGTGTEIYERVKDLPLSR